MCKDTGCSARRVSQSEFLARDAASQAYRGAMSRMEQGLLTPADKALIAGRATGEESERASNRPPRDSLHKNF